MSSLIQSNARLQQQLDNLRHQLKKESISAQKHKISYLFVELSKVNEINKELKKELESKNANLNTTHKTSIKHDSYADSDAENVN